MTPKGSHCTPLDMLGAESLPFADHFSQFTAPAEPDYPWQPVPLNYRRTYSGGERSAAFSLFSAVGSIPHVPIWSPSGPGIHAFGFVEYYEDDMWACPFVFLKLAVF
ncbi:MAG: hypothetical protein NVS1B4_02420 [Gemmatimonadaceae bacterium]